MLLYSVGKVYAVNQPSDISIAFFFLNNFYLIKYIYKFDVITRPLYLIQKKKCFLRMLLSEHQPVISEWLIFKVAHWSIFIRRIFWQDKPSTFQNKHFWKMVNLLWSFDQSYPPIPHRETQENMIKHCINSDWPHTHQTYSVT